MNSLRWSRFTTVVMLVALFATGCSDRPHSNPLEPPQPGVLAASLSVPDSGDRALLLELNGPAIGDVSAAPGTGYTLHSRAADGRVRVAVFGTVSSGALLRFAVPDVRKNASYSARLLEASDTTNALREDVGAYRIDLVPVP